MNESLVCIFQNYQYISWVCNASESVKKTAEGYGYDLFSILLFIVIAGILYFWWKTRI